MGDFKVIETQEQLDAVIKDRIARAEKNAVKEFADYEDIKKRNSEFEQQITDLTNQLKAKDETISGYESAKTELETKINKYEMGSLKTRIALETGLPFELAEKLTGEDEETIRADAQKMAQFIKPINKAPIGGAEPIDNSDPRKAAFQSLLKNMERS